MNARFEAPKACSPTSYTAMAGLDTDPVPMEPYRSPEFFEKERERIFRRSWLMIGREEEITKPGDFVRKEIEVCDASVIITRGKDGTVRAFHNVCSHRGNQLIVNERGNGSRFMCRYHNWTYANDGRLIGIPDESSFFGVDKKTCGLTPVACEVWEGWIFVNLMREPEISLAEFLGELPQFISGILYQNAATPVIVQADLDCNWKVISDAFSEAYHIPAIHPETIGATFFRRKTIPSRMSWTRSSSDRIDLSLCTAIRITCPTRATRCRPSLMARSRLEV